METAPIVVDGVMYLTTSYNHVYAHRRGDRQGVLALQAQDGAGHDLLLRPEQPRRGDHRATRSTWARSTPSWSRSTRRPARCCGSTQIADPEKGYSETMAPVVVNGKVLIGTNGGEYGIRGFVKAFDANDGKLLWTFYTIPEKGHEGVWAVNDATGRNMLRDIAAEKAQLAEQGRRLLPDARRRRVDDAGGRQGDQHRVLRRRQPLARPVRRRAARATTCTPTRSSRSTWTPAPTSGTSSTSRTTCGTWTRCRPVILTEAKDKAGKMRKVAIHGGKTGHVYVHDRATGELIRFSEAMIPQENMWVLPTAGRRAHAARRQRRRGVVARWRSTRSCAWPTRPTCTSR